MHDYGVEEGEAPVNCPTQEYNVDEKGHNDVLQKHGVAFYEFSGPERIEESLGETGYRIVFKAEVHQYLII
jgi:hypothetical protein